MSRAKTNHFCQYLSPENVSVFAIAFRAMVGYAKAIIILWCAMWSWSIELKLCRYHGANFVHWMCFVNGRMWFYLFVWIGNHRTMADSSFLCSTSLLVIAFWEWQFNNLAHATTHGTISASIAMCVCAVMRCNHRKIIVAGTNVTGVRCYAGGPSVKQVQTVEQFEFFASAFFLLVQLTIEGHLHCASMHRHHAKRYAMYLGGSQNPRTHRPKICSFNKIQLFI